MRVSHPVLLVSGSSASRDVRILNRTTGQTGDAAWWDGRFRGLVALAPGDNELEIAGEQTVVTREDPPENTPFVRTIYMTDSTGDTAYPSPDPHVAQRYTDKLDTSMKLLQAFTADACERAGIGRRTFRLELDDADRVQVHVLRGELPAAAYYELDDHAWYETVAREVHREFGEDAPVKNVVIAAYTRFDTSTGQPLGHTALGGGDLGLFGSGDLFSWPDELTDVLRVFHDVTPVDPATTFDDSSGRSVIWGLASTTLGATIHEIGHCFGLPHCADPFCIMTRGFDHLNRAFAVIEPPSAQSAAPVSFDDDEIARFCKSCARTLARCDWLLGP